MPTHPSTSSHVLLPTFPFPLPSLSLRVIFHQRTKVSPIFFFFLLTQDPGQDHPLHSGWRRPLPVLLRGDNVLGCEEQQEQKGQVGRRVADKLDEGLADEETVATLGSDEVAESKQRVEEADEDASEELARPVAPSPARKLIIPPGRQQLLAVWLCYKLTKIKE